MDTLLENFQNFNQEDQNKQNDLSDKIDKFKKIEHRTNIRFGIIVATYKRSDGTTPMRLQEALQSIKNQSYQNYKIYLMGDDYESDNEIKPLVESFEYSKIVYENLELPGERIRFRGADLWHSGSDVAANIAIDKAVRDGVNFICRLDHDDIWLPNHLEYMAKAITRYPKAKFFSSTAIIKRYKTGTDTYCRPERGVVKHIGGNNISHITESWHSTFCWDLKEFKDLRYRNVREQFLTSPVRSEPRGSDRDILERIKNQLVEKDLRWVNLPMITLLYRNKMGELPEIQEGDYV